VKPTLNGYPFDLILPPYTEAAKKEITRGLKFAHITQAYACKFCFWLVFLITAITLCIVYSSELGTFFENLFAGDAEKVDKAT
jgi:hypothetical protein